MFRLLLLLFALILAIYAQSLIANAENLARFVLRDGLILSIIAAFIFGLGVRTTPDKIETTNQPRQNASSASSIPLVPAILWLVVLLGLGIAVRYWAVDALPAQCIGAECNTLLHMADPQAAADSTSAAPNRSQPPLHFALTHWMSSQVDAPIEAIRLTGMVIGGLTLLAFFLFASQLVQLPAAFVITALLVQLPWHVWASATGDSRLMLPLLLSLVGWLALAGLRHRGSVIGTLLWFVAAGAALALLRIESGSAQLIPVLWLLLIALVSIIAFWGRGIAHVVSSAGGILAGFVVTLGLGAAFGLFDNALSISGLLSSGTATVTEQDRIGWLPWLGQNLFYRGDFGAVGTLFDEPILGLLLAGLAITGFSVVLVGSVESEEVETDAHGHPEESEAGAHAPHGPEESEEVETDAHDHPEESEAVESGDRRRPRESLWPLYVIVFAGLGAAGAGLWIINATTSIDPLTDAPASRLLILLPFLMLLAALSLDQILGIFATAWSRLIDSRQLTFALLGLALIFPALTMGNVLENFSGITVRGDDPLDPLLIEYLAEALPQTEAGSVTYLAPADFVEDPTVGLQLGSAFEQAVESGRLRPFNPAEDLLFVNSGPGELVYLLDGNDRGLIELMSQIFPTSFLETHSRSEPQEGANGDPSDSAQLVSLRVSMESILATRGLRLALFEGNEPAALGRQPIFVQGRMAPSASWEQVPISGPFSVEWTGTLLVPESGQYGFQAQSHPDAQLTLRLDNVTVLDSATGLSTGDLRLARGPYQFQLLYRSERFANNAQPSVFQLTWQPPEQGPAEIPTSLLQSQPPPRAGLLGSYFAGERFEEPELLFQKDLLVGLGVDLPDPYSVLWRGKLGATRAGEYRIGVLTDGRAAITVNGRMVADAMQATADQSETEEGAQGLTEADRDTRRYVEGVTYLRQGWHEIQIAFVPEAGNGSSGEAGVELFWVPPGGSPETIPMRAFLPYLGRVSMLEHALPPPPVLRAPHLGNNQFALSLPTLGQPPQVSFLADNITPVDISPLWRRSNGCGTGPEQLLNPHGVTIAPDTGFVYVTDTGNQQVVSFDLEGERERIFGGNDSLPEPFDIAMQFRREIGRWQPLVLDATTQTIFRLDPDVPGPAAISQVPLNTAFYRPRGFDVDSSGNIAVADTGGARVVLLSPDGNVIFEAGGRESALGIGQPVDALTAAGQLWTITAEDGRLWRVVGNADESGSLAAVIKTDTLNGPRLAALDNGSVFVADPVRGLVTFHRPDGQPINQLAHPSIVQPVGIDLSLVDGVLYMALTDGTDCSVSLWRLDRAMFGI